MEGLCESLSGRLSALRGSIALVKSLWSHHKYGHLQVGFGGEHCEREYSLCLMEDT